MFDSLTLVAILAAVIFLAAFAVLLVALAVVFLDIRQQHRVNKRLNPKSRAFDPQDAETTVVILGVEQSEFMRRMYLQRQSSYFSDIMAEHSHDPKAWSKIFAVTNCVSSKHKGLLRYSRLRQLTCSEVFCNRRMDQPSGTTWFGTQQLPNLDKFLSKACLHADRLFERGYKGKVEVLLITSGFFSSREKLNAAKELIQASTQRLGERLRIHIHLLLPEVERAKDAFPEEFSEIFPFSLTLGKSAQSDQAVQVTVHGAKEIMAQRGNMQTELEHRVNEDTRLDPGS